MYVHNKPICIEHLSLARQRLLPLLKGYPKEETRASPLHPKFSEDHYDLPTDLERKESAVGEVQVLSTSLPSQEHLNPTPQKEQKGYAGHNANTKTAKETKYSSKMTKQHSSAIPCKNCIW